MPCSGPRWPRPRSPPRGRSGRWRRRGPPPTGSVVAGSIFFYIHLGVAVGLGRAGLTRRRRAGRRPWRALDRGDVAGLGGHATASGRHSGRPMDLGRPGRLDAGASGSSRAPALRRPGGRRVGGPALRLPVRRPGGLDPRAAPRGRGPSTCRAAAIRARYLARVALVAAVLAAPELVGRLPPPIGTGRPRGPTAADPPAPVGIRRSLNRSSVRPGGADSSMRENVPSLLWAWALLSPFLFRLLPGGTRRSPAWSAAGRSCRSPLSRRRSSRARPGIGGSAHAVAVPASAARQQGDGDRPGLPGGPGPVRPPGLRAAPVRRRSTCRWSPGAWSRSPRPAANGLPLSGGPGAGPLPRPGLGRALPDGPGLPGRRRVAAGGSPSAWRRPGWPTCRSAWPEIVDGPVCLPDLAYGPHPYQFEGAARLLGYRPLGFLEHGNQLGMWMAGSAVAATWLWASGAAARPWGVPGGAAGLDLDRAPRSSASRTPASSCMAVALLPLLGGRLPAPGLLLAGRGVGGPGPRSRLAVSSLAARRASTPAALRGRRPRLLPGHATRRRSPGGWPAPRNSCRSPCNGPVLGWARPTGGRGGLAFVNPVNLATWLLTLGMYGVVGLAASTATWLAPAGPGDPAASGRSWLGPGGGARPPWSPWWPSISSTALPTRW